MTSPGAAVLLSCPRAAVSSLVPGCPDGQPTASIELLNLEIRASHGNRGGWTSYSTGNQKTHHSLGEFISKPKRAHFHDKVVRIDPANFTVTMKMTFGFSFGKAIAYMSTDSNNPIAATLEESTLTPALDDASQDIRDIDAIPGQGNERIVIVVNGPQNSPGAGLGVSPYEDVNPFRQGLYSAIVDGRDPLNIFGGIPTINLDYSPIWDAEFVGWTQPAIDRGYRTRLIDLLNLYSLEEKGVVQNFNLSDGTIGGKILRSGVLINCPVIARFM